MLDMIAKAHKYYKNYGLKATLHRIFGNDCALFSRLPPEKYEEYLKKWYKRLMGETPNLEAPKTYNEKIQWMKLYDSTPLKTRLADKYLVRDWIKEKLGEEYLIPLLGVWDDFDEIDFSRLPGRFVLKTNHGSGWNVIVKDKSKLNMAAARKKFKKWMRMNFAFQHGLELHYLNIPPKIIAEEYIESADGDLADYKVWCFEGKAVCVMVCSQRAKDLRLAFYDPSWNKQCITYSFPRDPKVISRPVQLDKLIQLSETLAAGFNHVRIDFYILDDGSLKFGEMTFTPDSGVCKWDPPEQDRAYGDLLPLPAQKSAIPTRSTWVNQ